jgi:hypothetical protein
MALTSGWRGFGGLGAVGCDASCKFVVEEGRQRRRAVVEVTGRSNGGLHLSGKRGRCCSCCRREPVLGVLSRWCRRGEGAVLSAGGRAGEVVRGGRSRPSWGRAWGRVAPGGLGLEAEGRRIGGKKERKKKKEKREKKRRKEKGK